MKGPGMSTLATMLKQEIRRVARREITSQTSVVRRASAQYRRDIAELKRVMRDLVRRVEFIEKQERRRVASRPPTALAEKARFSPQWVKAQRTRLGLSGADYGKIVGVSPLTIYNWEAGKSKPRQQQLASLVRVRDLGKREALRRLEMLE